MWVQWKALRFKFSQSAAHAPLSKCKFRKVLIVTQELRHTTGPTIRISELRIRISPEGFDEWHLQAHTVTLVHKRLSREASDRKPSLTHFLKSTHKQKSGLFTRARRRSLRPCAKTDYNFSRLAKSSDQIPVDYTQNRFLTKSQDQHAKLKTQIKKYGRHPPLVRK